MTKFHLNKRIPTIVQIYNLHYLNAVYQIQNGNKFLAEILQALVSIRSKDNTNISVWAT